VSLHGVTMGLNSDLLILSSSPPSRSVIPVPSTRHPRVNYAVIPCYDTGSITGADRGPVSWHGVTIILDLELDPSSRRVGPLISSSRATTRDRRQTLKWAPCRCTG